MLIVCYCLERRVHEAGHFLTKSRKLPLIVNLVQLSGRDKNEKPTEPAHRVIEQVRKFDAQVIVLYLENKNIELLLQQVRIRSLLSFKSALFHQRKFHNSSFLICLILSQRPCQHEKKYIWIIQGEVWFWNLLKAFQK